jgi:hypothetical protein
MLDLTPSLFLTGTSPTFTIGATGLLTCGQLQHYPEAT